LEVGLELAKDEAVLLQSAVSEIGLCQGEDPGLARLGGGLM
jgi:hypothetical protein